MRRFVLLMLWLVLLMGCRPPIATPPPSPPSHLPELVRVVAVVAGQEYVLYPNGSAITRLLAVEGEVVFEYSGPVDADPDQSILEASGHTVRTYLLGATRVVRTPPSIRDKQGRLLKSREFYLERVSYVPVRAYWVFGPLTEELKNPDGPPTLIMPGESIKLEFEEEVDKAIMAAQLTATLGPGVKYKLAWPNKKTLLFELSAAQDREFLMRFDETTYFGFLTATPKRLVVLDKNHRAISTLDVPISITSAIAMTQNFGQARLVRRVNLAWLHLGIKEYLLDVQTGTIQPSTLHSQGTWYADEILLDWIERTYSSAKLEGYFPAGLSNSGSRLALYEDGSMKLIELSTNQTRLITVQSRPESGVNFPRPHRVFWSHDDRCLYYTALLGPDQPVWLYRLDLSTGIETPLLKGHNIRSVSPHSHHIFTETWEGLSPACYMVDSSGKIAKLSGPGEDVVVTKWLDAKRVIINKTSTTGQKCYLYYLDENRWEHICDGYGFDYDLYTGRMFVLQNR